MNRLSTLSLLGLAGTSSALLLGGCMGMGNVNYPPIDGQTATGDLNQPAARHVMATALIYATNRYPPVAEAPVGEKVEQPLAFNLPPGVSDGTYHIIQNDVSERNVTAVALTDRTKDRPVYHVTRVVVRGTDAEVDVLVPRYNLGPGVSGEQMYSGVSLDMRGGFRPWQVISARSFQVTSADLPALNPMPE